ncbi:uncharacterized protein LOC115881931 isoform X2 [Sitophilus oryzae]|nr:uncharacterized protein LOC115881931 isoform X2 [Sitophilus oryzae]
MSLVPQKSFGSFCVKCAACLAVANQIEHLIRDLSYECETDPLKKKVLLENIVNHINTLCISGFKNFDLREYKSHHIITDDFRCTHHVESNMDGNWTKKLRELCKLYTSRVNIEDISFNVLDSVGNLTDTFCRSTGIFRDCLKINSHQNSTIDC